MSDQAKVCTKCGKEYPATREYFTPIKNGKYGLHSQCMTCRRKIKDPFINIYALIDPRTNLPFYIGRTNNTAARLIEHITESRTLWKMLQELNDGNYYIHPKNQRIADILNAGLRPQIAVLETALPDDAQQVEAKWMDAMIAQGIELTNMQRTRKGQHLPYAEF